MEHNLNRLAQLQHETLRAQAAREIDTCMLMALIKLHPDPTALREAWRPAAAEMTTRRVLLAAAHEDPVSAQAISSEAVQSRIRFWERVLDRRIADDDPSSSTPP